MRISSRMRGRVWAWLFVIPALALYTILVVAPSVLSVIYSLVDWQGLSPDLHRFNGFKYYKQAFHDPVVATGLQNNGRAFLLFAFITLPIALVLSTLLARYVRGVSFFRALYFVPSITSVALIALVFQLFFTTDAGLNGVLRAAGLDDAVRPWLSHEVSGRGSLMLRRRGYTSGSGSSSSSQRLTESTNNCLKQLRSMAPDPGMSFGTSWCRASAASYYSRISCSIVLALQSSIFQLVMPADPGGPLNQTHTLASYTYSLVVNSGRTTTDWGYASALGIVMFAITGVAAMLLWILSRRRGK